jgi:hypothetical protein
MQNPVVDLLMNTHGQSSLLEYHLSKRNSFNRLYHIRPNCFKSYRGLTSFTQYMLRFACTFRTGIPPGTFIYISESSDTYKYAVITSINCKDRWFCIARDIKYQKIIPFIIGEYIKPASFYILPHHCSHFFFKWIPIWIQQEKFWEEYVSHKWTPFYS